MDIIFHELIEEKILMVQGDNLDVSEILSSKRLSILRKFVHGYDFLFIDEAQEIPDIGINLKLIVDNIPELKILISSSSTFDLRNRIGEPLTGRSKYFKLYPIAQLETNEDYLESKGNLETKLIYGTYPQVFTTDS